MMKRRTLSASQPARFEGLERRRLMAATSGLLGAYYDTPDFSGPALSRVDANVAFNWQSGAPLPSMSPDTFSVRWTGQIKAKYSERYTFSVTADDGVRLWVDGQLIVDAWQPTDGFQHSGKITLQAGQLYDVRLDYREDTGKAQAKLVWSSASQAKQTVPTTSLYPSDTIPEVVAPDTPAVTGPARVAAPGLRAEYFNGLNQTTFAATRTDGQINFDWAAGSPSPLVNADMFSVRWSGQVTTPTTGQYTFYTTSDDGIRVWIDGRLVINESDNPAAPEHSGAITLAGGVAHDISVEYYEATGPAVARLEWARPGGAREVIPAAQFSHFVTAAAAAADDDGLGGVAAAVAAPADSDRLVSWFSIGFSSNVAADRNVGWNLKELGWAGFIERHVKPQIAWGARRIVLGNPFGALGGEQMQFDQYVHAQQAGLTWLTDGFAEAWRPITDSGVEVIAYLGAIPHDPDFNGGAAQWQPRFWQSINPALDAGMNVAFDAISGVEVTSTGYAAVKLAESRGAKVYIEPRPNKATPHWHGYPVISIDSFWKRSDPALQLDAVVWAATNEQVTGEVIRLIAEPPQGETWSTLPTWLRGQTNEITLNGHTVAFGALPEIIQRFTLDELVTLP